MAVRERIFIFRLRRSPVVIKVCKWQDVILYVVRAYAVTKEKVGSCSMPKNGWSLMYSRSPKVASKSALRFEGPSSGVLFWPISMSSSQRWVKENEQMWNAADWNLSLWPCWRTMRLCVQHVGWLGRVKLLESFHISDVAHGHECVCRQLAHCKKKKGWRSVLCEWRFGTEDWMR